MEDEDGGLSRRSLLLNTSSSSLLYCDEDLLLVSTPPPPAHHDGAAADDDDTSTSNLLPQPAASSVVAGGEEEAQHLQELLVEHMARQGCYAPSRGYLDHLLQKQQGRPPPAAPAAIIPDDPHGVAAARSRGVHYIIYAFGRLGLSAATAFSAVNYLDRFLSINCHLRWEAWMVELVSVACLSVACKLEEVSAPPSLHHLQVEEAMSHSFRASSVRDMELTLLKALQWRLACVTPYSFLQLLLPFLRGGPAATAAAAATRLLIRSLAEPSLLLRFDSSVIAASAIRCVSLQHQQQDRHGVASSSDIISRLLIRHPHDDRPTAQDKDDDGDECLKMMQALYDDATPCCCGGLDYLNSSHHLHCYYLYSGGEQQQQWSPAPVVIPSQTHGASSGTTMTTVNRSAVSRRLFFLGGSTTQHHQARLSSQEDDDERPN